MVDSVTESAAVVYGGGREGRGAPWFGISHGIHTSVKNPVSAGFTVQTGNESLL